MSMIRNSLLAATALFALAAGPAFAADCATEVKMAEKHVMESKDMKAKEMGMKELEMAKKAEMGKMNDDCMKHAKMATDAVMMKK